MASVKCFGCGVQKDTDVLEVYPYPEDGVVDDPIAPLLVLDCESASAFSSRRVTRFASAATDRQACQSWEIKTVWLGKTGRFAYSVWVMRMAV